MRLFSVFRSVLLPAVLALTPLCGSLHAQETLLSKPDVDVHAISGQLLSRSAVVLDMDKDLILYAKDADTRIQPASLTKVLSLFVALDAIDRGQTSMDSPVLVSAKAAQTGESHMGIRDGETLPLRELFMGMAVASGNDASTAVAEHVGGSVEKFVAMMNAKAQSLRMEGSHFTTPHGLPSANQYTTARDMMLLGRAYLRSHPEMLSFHNTHYLKHGLRLAWNRNPLLGNYPGADGLKTGWVKASGYNLITTAQRDGHRLLAVILGAPDALTRAKDAYRLLEAGFTSLSTGEPYPSALAGVSEEQFNPDLRLTAHEAFAAYHVIPRRGQAGKNNVAASGRNQTKKAQQAARRRTQAANARQSLRRQRRS